MQCSPSQATSANLAAAVTALGANGVAVSASACGYALGIGTAAVCGALTGEIWLVAVTAGAPSLLSSLGYQPLSSLPGAAQAPCANGGG